MSISSILNGSVFIPIRDAHIMREFLKNNARTIGMIPHEMMSLNVRD